MREETWGATGVATLLRRARSSWSAHPERNGAIVLGALTALWLLEFLMPTFERIPHYDDTAYIRSGHWLVEHGAPRVFVWGPFITLLHALAYVVVQGSPDWFVWTAAGGRIGSYALLCAGVYLCARAMAPHATPWAALVIGLTWPLAASFLSAWNASDVLFMAMSALALSRMLAYLSDPSRQHLLWGSAFVGLAALTRPDGLVLLLSFVALVYATHARDVGVWWRPPGWRRPLGAAVGPAALLIVGYLVLYGTATGSWSTGLPSRTYQAFEQGHGVVFRERYTGNAMVGGYDDVRALFGTREDNDGSVLRAIARNPTAFLDRVAHSAAQLPDKTTRAFGGPLTVVLLFLAARGALALWRGRQRWPLVVLLGWHLHMLSYFLTFWRVGYLRFAFVALALLGGIGASAIARGWADWRERTAAAAVLGAMVAWLVFDGSGRMWGDPGARTAAVLPAALLGLALFVPTLTPACRRRPDGAMLSLLAGVVMVSAVAVAAGRSPSDRLPTRFGESPQEHAVAVAAEEVPPGVAIGSHGIKLPAAARRPVRTVGDLVARPVSASAWDRWLGASAVGAVYLNPFLRREYPAWFDFLVARFNADAQWLPAFAEDGTNTWLFVRRSLPMVREIWRSHDPVLRSGFDVFVLDGLLVYVKENCSAEDASRRFFVFVHPVSDDSLTPRQRRKGGVADLRFDFDRNGFRIDGRCIATRTLPGYPISHVVTGQYVPGEQRFWEGRIDFPAGRAAAGTGDRADVVPVRPTTR